MKRPLHTLALSSLLLGGLVIPVSACLGQTSPLLLRDYPSIHVVEEGDTMTSVASRFLVDPANWPELWTPTPGMENDSGVVPGDTVRVEFINGRPRLVAQSGSLPVQRLSPRMREIAVTSTIPEVRLQDIQGSFTRNRILPETEYGAAPYILAPLGNNLVIGTGDEIYARGTWPPGVGTFQIYRQVNSFSDPDDRQRVDVELETVGHASVLGAEAGDIRRLIINGAEREIQVGDRLLVSEEIRLDQTVYPAPPDRPVDGRIIAMTNAERMASQLDTVLLDVGYQAGLKPGNVLWVRQPGGAIVDGMERQQKSLASQFRAFLAAEKVELPQKEVGMVLVYKIFDNLSYGVILSSEEPLRVGDMVVNP